MIYRKPVAVAPPGRVRAPEAAKCVIHINMKAAGACKLERQVRASAPSRLRPQAARRH
ncbi:MULTISPECIES: hypothetical protein [Cupriavidus]